MRDPRPDLHVPVCNSPPHTKDRSTSPDELTQEIYTTQPEGFVSAKYPNHVYTPKKSPYGLKIDNQSAISVAYAPENLHSARLKHLDVRLHHIRDEIAKGTVQLTYCPTEIMAADILTKALPGPARDLMIDLLNLSRSDIPNHHEAKYE